MQFSLIFVKIFNMGMELICVIETFFAKMHYLSKSLIYKISCFRYFNWKYIQRLRTAEEWFSGRKRGKFFGESLCYLFSSAKELST